MRELSRAISLLRTPMRLLCAAMLFTGCTLLAQSTNAAEEQIKNLVVVVRSTFSSGADTGAGIIFGAEGGHLQVLTANHVVRKGAEAAQNVDVEFRWLPGERVNAQLLNMDESSLDLAVLSVPASAPPNLLHFDRLGNPSTVNRGDPVFSVGHPNGKLWEANVQPDVMSQKDGIHLFFQSGFIAPGHSGGALLNSKWELIGMLRSDQPPLGEAIGIDRIIQWLTANQLNVELRGPGAPSSLSQLEADIQDDVKYACGSLAAFSKSPDTKGETIIAELTGAQSKVESDSRFSDVKSPLIGMMYRCLGGAHLIDSRVDNMGDKIRSAMPYLKRSLDYDPGQQLLQGNIAVLQKFLDDKGGDIKVYISNLFEIFEGARSQDEGTVSAMVDYTKSNGYQAQQWLMQQATKPPLQEYLDALRLMLKKERNLDVTVDVSNKTLPSGLVEVSAKVGVNNFSWTVDYPKKEYTGNDDFTRKFMDVVVNGKH